MAVYLTEVVTDLAMPPQQRPIPHQFAMGDNNAYTITALLCDSRNPEAELLDGTVGGELVRPDGVTVALEGEKGDAVRQVNLAAGGLCNATPCSVTLPQACFAVPGRVTLTIKLTDGTTITQALSVSAVVVRTSTDEAVDPGEVIPDLAAIQAAAAEAVEAAEDATAAAADARAAASSAVRYDTAQSLTDAQKTTARGNIAAASLIPDGTAFSQAVQGGTTYDVQDTAAVHYTAQTLTEAQKTTARENIAAAGEADFEGVTGYVPTSESGSTTKNGITIAADGTRVTISGTATASLGAKYSSDVELTGYTATTLATWGNAAAVPVVQGQLYRLSYRAISGSISGSATINVYGPNEWRALASGAQLAVNTSIDFVAATDFVEIVGYIGNGVTTGSAPFVLEMTLTAVNAEGHTVKLADAAPVIAAVAGVSYVCTASYVTSLSFTPNASGICSVRFTSGTTPTVLTLPDTVKMPDWWNGCEANRTYEISIEDGVYGAVTSWA